MSYRASSTSVVQRRRVARERVEARVALVLLDARERAERVEPRVALRLVLLAVALLAFVAPLWRARVRCRVGARVLLRVRTMNERLLRSTAICIAAAADSPPLRASQTITGVAGTSVNYLAF